jgi:hypothetical protein
VVLSSYRCRPPATEKPHARSLTGSTSVQGGKQKSCFLSRLGETYLNATQDSTSSVDQSKRKATACAESFSKQPHCTFDHSVRSRAARYALWVSTERLADAQGEWYSKGGELSTSSGLGLCVGGLPFWPRRTHLMITQIKSLVHRAREAGQASGSEVGNSARGCGRVGLKKGHPQERQTVQRLPALFVALSLLNVSASDTGWLTGARAASLRDY